jgi:hypothetical protein
MGQGNHSFLDPPYFRIASGIHKNCKLAIEARSPQKIKAEKSV